MPIIAVVRPGCTDFDEQNRIQGNLDLPLNDRGRDQLAATITQLQLWPLDTLFTSPLEPARTTAESIGEELQVSVQFHENLKNVDQGLWQGLSLDEIRRTSPKVLKQWQESPETVRPPEGETIQEALARALKVLEKPLKREESIAVVTSEPLATLLGCAITAVQPEFDSVAGCRCSEDLVAIYSTNGRLPRTDPKKPWRTLSATGSLLTFSETNRGRQSG